MFQAQLVVLQRMNDNEARSNSNSPAGSPVIGIRVRGPNGSPLGKKVKVASNNKKDWVWQSFKPKLGSSSRVVCNYCSKELSDKNGNRLKLHLLNNEVCSYLKHEDAAANKESDCVSALKQLKPDARKPYSATSGKISGSGSTGQQQQIGIGAYYQKMSDDLKAQMDADWANVIYNCKFRQAQ
jgi:hypothetical protein